MSVDTERLADGYREALRAYLRDSDESSLNQGYELARRALVEGCGILEMADIHHLALRRLAAEHAGTDQVLSAAGSFFSECLSPFEMTHRGAKEGARALHHLNEVLETELKRVAHALHDEAGQLLASVHIAIAEVATSMPAKLQGRLDHVEDLLKQIELDLRDLSHELRPTVLDNLGLVPALEFLGERVAKRTGLVVSVTGGTGARLPGAVETALYRIVQEALNNAVKHAHARSVSIDLNRTGLRATCTVHDDGVGFDAADNAGAQGLGLAGIRERLSALGGCLRIVTAPGRGSTLLLEVPLRG